MTGSIAEAYGRRLALVNSGLEAVLPPAGREPRRLHEAMRHAVFGGGGGKRLRPVLLLSAAADLGVADDRALPAALALELVHCYSLVHDDLPCMDDAGERRGAPSVHAAFGYAVALLAGDALLTQAFEILGRAANSGLPRPGELLVELATAAGSGGMVGGQDLDLALGEGGAGPAGPDLVLRVHRMKTAPLYGFALVAPAHLAGVSAAEVRRWREAGVNFGLAFQAADDLRDASEDRRAPNLAKAAGTARAREMARESLRECEAALIDLAGLESGTLALVRAAAREMGL